MIRALIFDFDGLLIDTETPAFVSTQAMYKEHGHELTLELWKDALGRKSGQGFNAYEHLAILVGNNFDAEKAKIKRYEHKIHLCHLEALRPGVVGTIASAKTLGLTCTVASSSGREWVEGWLQKHDALQHFAFTKTADDVENVKPAPDLFLSVAEKLCVQPHECLVFEDSPNGTLAALSAGMPCVVVTNPVTEALEFPSHTLRLKQMDEMRLEGILEIVSKTV